MPSFSSLLKNSRIRSDSRQEDRMDGGVSLDTVNNVNNEKVQRRQSKRDFVRGLLKRSSVGGKRRPNTQIKVADPRASPINFSSMPPTPMSPKSDPNKPLPPPPASGTVNEESAKAPVKLDRIMSPIGASELHKLFQGAPQFFSRAEEQQTGEPFPSVAFPWDTNVSIRDLSDHIQIPNAAWSSVTAWPHITRDLSRNPETVSELHENQKTHYMPGCRERPNMLSMQGIERGTMGFQAALESEVADALKEDEQEFTDGTTLADRRAEFIHSKDGVRAFSESTLIELLMNVSTTYHEDPLRNSRSEVQLYSELFTQLLHPPRRVLDAEDPYSLQVQIEVLLRVLESPGVWIDFSLVEWRIRLGQIIWGPPPNPDPEDFMSVDGEQVEPDAQKFWLLLQILLSCELIVRLDAISQNQEGRDKSRCSALERFDNSVTEEVKWSLILGRLWLENIRIERTKPDTIHERKSSGSWLSALTGRTPSDGDHDDENAGVSYLDNFQFRGRNQDRQLSGLLYFAQELQWPHIEPLAAKVSANLIRISDSVPTTPLVGTPLTAASQPSSSYFPDRRPPIRRGISRPQKISMLVNPTGWLSNSYLSGLILPGESMSHLLISTLLENDDRAVSVLGEDTNLYGGFIYYDRSFWSTSSIVGRVLAARKGANECMGWVSSDVTPRNFIGEVWVNVDVDTTLVSAPDKPRIWQETSIEHDGDVIAGADASSVLPGDFAIPKEHPSQQTYFITLKSFELFESTESVHSTPTREIPTPYSNVSKTSQIQTYSAMMNFVIEGQVQKELSYALHHDVLFVTAHPCVPSSHLQMLNSPTSPEFQLPRNRVAGSVSGHALHKAFSYSQVPLSVLLVSPSQSLTSLLSPALSRSRESPSPSPSSSGPIKTVLVIDCTYTEALSQHISSMHISISEPKHTLGNDMEVLVRALCAEKGWNALISRRGQSCIACAVRELNALGWAETGVVLRL